MIIWLSLCTTLVLLMLAGFCLLETGLVRSKNSINVAIKSLFSVCIGGATFALFGYMIMAGNSVLGIFGADHPYFSSLNTPENISLFVLHLSMCCVAIAIVSGAVAERMRFRSYVLVACLISTIVYPVVGHWIWATDVSGNPNGWLANLGFIDFAGATVIHSSSAWFALVCVIVLGPRIGRFDNDKPIQPQNLTYAVVGCLFLFIGWVGLNGGAAYSSLELIPTILANTIIAGIAAGCGIVLMNWLSSKPFSVFAITNGMIGGLVSISAAVNLLSPSGAAILGLLGATVAYYGSEYLASKKIDDVLGAISAHGFAGAFGTIVFPFFVISTNEQFNTPVLEQVWIQFIGVSCVFAWVFVVGFSILKLIKQISPLRVTSEIEKKGLNSGEHASSTPITELIQEMEKQCVNNVFDSHVDVDPHTEVGVIAKQYNLVIEKVNQESRKKQEAIEKADIAKAYAENAVKIKDEFVAAMSQELRSPLTAIKGSVDLLLADVVEPLTPALRTHLELISRNVVREHEFVDKLLDLQALDINKIKVDPQLCKVSDILNEAMVKVKKRYPDKIHQIEVDSDNANVFVETDKQRLSNAIYVVLENAIYATNENQFISIHVQKVDDKVQFIVKDEGKGINDEIKNHIFEPFYQFDSPDTRKPGHLGISLATTKNVLNALSGKISFVTKIDEGSTFVIEIPLIQNALLKAE